MHRLRFTPLLFVLGLTACVAVIDLPGPHHEPFVQLVQIRSDWREPIYGPASITYELTIFNPSDRTLFVRAVDLHSSGGGIYHVAAQTRRLNLTVAPHENVSARVRVSAWASGGQASAYEPVTIHGVLHYGRGQELPFQATP
jgi:hypothetical protein